MRPIAYISCVLICTPIWIASASWRGPKLESCELHPDIEARLLKDVSYWGDTGISEEVAVSMAAYCDMRPATGTGSGSGAAGERQQEQEGEKENCNKPQRVLISNGTVYLTNLIAARYLGPFEMIGHLVELYEASQVYRLPDVEFTYWFGDNAPAHTMTRPDGSSAWPHHPSAVTPAVLHWSKWNQNAALVVPYSGAFRCAPDSWDFLEGQLDHLAREEHWRAKKEVAFGRWNAFCTHYISWMKTADGQVMRCPRTHLPQLAAARPDLLDTKHLGEARGVPLEQQRAYKYLVSTDGWSISSKFDKYLLLGSTVLKAASTRYGWYYDAIKPYTHYLPYMVNSSDDIIDVVSWARAHDEEARHIAGEGRRFALRHLTRGSRLCYIFRLLSELAKKMRYTPSCTRRQLCVPLVEEVKFLSKYERTKGSCRYKEVLLRYGEDDPAAAAGEGQYGELWRLHEGGAAWPRDDLAQGVQGQQGVGAAGSGLVHQR